MKKLLSLLSLCAFTVATTATTVSVFASNKPNLQVTNQFATSDDGVQDLSDVITTPNLGEIDIPDTVTTIAQKKGFLKNKLRDLNPNLDMNEVDITNITETRAIVVPLNNWKTYWGNVQITYHFVTTDVNDELPDVNDLITKTQLGNIKLHYDYEMLVNSEDIRAKIDYLNIGIWSNDLVITNITRTSAVVSGDNEVYTGSVTVTFNTLSVYMFDKEAMDAAFAGNWIGTLDRSKASNWKSIASFFFRNLGQNTWIGRSSMNYFAFKTAIENHFNNYFGINLEIKGFKYYTGINSEVRYANASNFRTTYLQDSDEFEIFYRCQVNGSWTDVFDTYSTISFINESVGLKDRFAKLQNNLRNHNVVFKIPNASLEGIVDYAAANKEKIIKDYSNSDYFKSFAYLNRQRRIKIDYTGDWQNQVYNQGGKLILEIKIDTLPTFENDRPVAVYDAISFDWA